MTTKKAKTQTKMQIATKLYNQYKDKKPRAEIVNLFVEKADLSKAGANSYYEKIKNKQ